MKKILSFLLTFALLAGLCAVAAAEPAPALPQVGESVYGFTLKESRAFPLVGAQMLVFEHEKSGAKLTYIANNDTNRVFDLTFFTRAEDETGLPHVLEHAVLKGSEKYPSSSLFFNLLYQTYNTYMNAETGPNYTSFPVSSLSEAQLLLYADFYTDSCLHPRVLEDESIFREEAWRYRLEDTDAPLRIEGTVYSEMQAAANLYQSSYYNMMKTAFPGSVSGNLAGGEPSDIPQLSWEALKDYHTRYYLPSNCMVWLYGKFDDYGAFLKLLDEAFSPYGREASVFADTAYAPLGESAEASFRFPAETGTDTECAADLYYVFLCPGLKENAQEELYLNTLTDLMAAEASPVSRKLQESLPTAFLGTWISLGTPEAAIVFNLSGIDAEDAQTARDAIDAGLREIAESGFAQELVDALSSGLNMNMRLIRENTALGISLLAGQMIPFYAETGRIFDCLDYMEGLRQLDAWNQAGVYSRVVSDWLLACETRVLTVTSPEPGLREELDAAETERLAAVKATMSEEDLLALVAQTNAAEEEEDASAAVAQLRAVTVQSLPEEVPQYEVREARGENGLRWLSAAADVDDVGMPVVLLDAAGVPQEDLHWFVLYLSLLGQLDTASHTQEELEPLLSRYLYGAEFRQSLMDQYGTKDYHPYLRAGWISDGADLEMGYALLYEVLFETRFDDAEALGGLIERNLSGLRSLLGYSAYNTMMYRALGAETPLYAYYSWCNGLDYFAFLGETAQRMSEEPEAVVRKLEEIQRRFCNSTNAVSLFAGSQDMIAENRSLSGHFFSRLNAEPVEAVDYVFETPAMREALVVDETVQYNGLVGSYEAMGLAAYTADLDAVSALVTDLCLLPMLRETYGVYTPMHYYDSFAGAYLISYRDPNIEETFAVYEALPALLEEAEIDQEQLDGYILSCYAAYAMPQGELSGALAAVTSRLCGEPEDLKRQQMEALKALSPETLREYAEAYRELVQNGRRFTVGSESVISEHAELYDVILRPFS